jgi:predicted DCC family thiol-disulfide oxidoreductase YuxK
VSSLDKLNIDKLSFDKPSTNKVVLFDGVCNFCNSSVQFIIKHDSTNSLKFASLQSNFGQDLISKYNLSKSLDSVIYFEDFNIYIKSKAAFKIASNFSGIWKLLLIFKILPTALTDFFYDIIANNRYKWFGKSDSCMLPSKEIRDRFIEI